MPHNSNYAALATRHVIWRNDSCGHRCPTPSTLLLLLLLRSSCGHRCPTPSTLLLLLRCDCYCRYCRSGDLRLPAWHRDGPALPLLSSTCLGLITRPPLDHVRPLPWPQPGSQTSPWCTRGRGGGGEDPRGARPWGQDRSWVRGEGWGTRGGV